MKTYTFTYNGFHGYTKISVRGPEQSAGSEFEISARTARRIARLLCPFGDCRCGEGGSLIREGDDHLRGGRWEMRYFFCVPPGSQVRGGYPQS